MRHFHAALIVALLAAAVPPAPLAVMVHGAGGGGWEYDFWRPVFERAGYRVETPTLAPGPQGLGKTTFADYTKQVESLGRPDVLIGASMGGVLVLKAAAKLRPRCLVLVCSGLPAGISPMEIASPYPEVIRWKGGPYEDTVASMPDSDEETRRWAWIRWRDESGAVLNEIRTGVSVTLPKARTLSVIPLADDTVSPADQMKLARWVKADILQFEGMSHVGPLLSTNARDVAKLVVKWLKSD
ncbi:MAG: alpha/beta hydrolase [Fimbriimonadaceae bacterium]|nr:alpha/beta hydrolase [Fimbriimonadaceae bacterium]